VAPDGRLVYVELGGCLLYVQKLAVAYIGLHKRNCTVAHRMVGAENLGPWRLSREAITLEPLAPTMNAS
jgi:hypothetical protein